MKKSNSLLYLFFIFLAGLLLRFYGLANYPPSLNWDEVSHAYNAFSILHKGTDQWGQLPIFNFRAYGDYPAALNLYFTASSIFFFGATDFAVRLPHALIGSLAILVVFAAAYCWRRDAKLALLAALFMALDPWALFPSRAVFQSNWAVFFLSLGLAFYFRKKLFSALVFWGISLYAYHNTRIFVPLLVLPLLPQIKSQQRLLLPLLLLFLPVLVALLSPAARARSSWVGLLDAGSVSGIEAARNQSKLPGILPRLIYNRPVYIISETAKHYVGYFSPQFLFFQGGTQYQFSQPGFGVLSPASLPFFYFGLVLLVLRRQKFLLYWLLLAPLPAAITRDNYAVIRATTMLPAVFLVAAYGLSAALKKANWVMIPFAIVLYFFVEQYIAAYLVAYPKKYSQSWQYGYRQVIESANPKAYSQIIITKKYGEPHEYVLWYKQLLQPQVVWDYHANWYWVDGVNNYRFVNDWDMASVVSHLGHGKYLLVGSSSQSLPGNLIKQINFLDGSPAFIMNEYEK